MSFEVQPYDYPSSQLDDFERKGHPGKFHQSITCGVGVTTFTGSNFGVGGILVTPGTTGTASLSLGGNIPLALLSSGSIRVYELSLSSVTVDSGTVYVLIRNQVAK
jgi:hypothetical protein